MKNVSGGFSSAHLDENLRQGQYYKLTNVKTKASTRKLMWATLNSNPLKLPTHTNQTKQCSVGLVLSSLVINSEDFHIFDSNRVCICGGIFVFNIIWVDTPCKNFLIEANLVFCIQCHLNTPRYQ